MQGSLLRVLLTELVISETKLVETGIYSTHVTTICSISGRGDYTRGLRELEARFSTEAACECSALYNP